MTNKEKQRKIANWILERAYAESDSPDSYTRAEIVEMLQNKEKLRRELLEDYLEAFGETYEGNILEDTVLDIKQQHALEKLASGT